MTGRNKKTASIVDSAYLPFRVGILPESCLPDKIFAKPIMLTAQSFSTLSIGNVQQGELPTGHLFGETLPIASCLSTVIVALNGFRNNMF